jgi:hypothetical protein
MQEQLKDWSVSSLEIGGVTNRNDTLDITGRFAIDFSAAGDSHNISIASPLGSYLLGNIFSDVRKNDYCQSGPIRLEETIIIDHAKSGVTVGAEYSDSWTRQGLSFTDQLTMNGDQAIYHRLFDYAGETINAVDYNAFRDFLLSRRDQQYVRLQK